MLPITAEELELHKRYRDVSLTSEFAHRKSFEQAGFELRGNSRDLVAILNSS
jgi:hypothetical protein